MDNGRNGGKFSEGGRMGFEPVENVGLAAKESAQEILKIFNQVHEPRVVHPSLLPSTPPVDCRRAYLIGQRSAWVVGIGLAAQPRSACPSSGSQRDRSQHSCGITTVSTVQAVSLLQSLLYNQTSARRT